VNRLAVVGEGRIGRALAVGCPGAALISGRELLAKRDPASLLGPAQTVVHAAGPAGEAACKEDPGLAFGLHFTLTERLMAWLQDAPHRRLVLLGTVAPNVGFYGPLKRAAIDRAWSLRGEDSPGSLTVVECGHVIGVGLPVSDRNAGVVARFVQAAVQGGRLVLAGGGTQQVRYTPLAELTAVVKQVVLGTREPGTWAPVSPPVRVTDIARTCLNLARLLYEVDRGVMVGAPHRLTPPDYADPTGVELPVAALPDVLIAWMRTAEVKILLGTR
jgi:nucleoside-diphosphate-sugar epimerase